MTGFNDEHWEIAGQLKYDVSVHSYDPLQNRGYESVHGIDKSGHVSVSGLMQDNSLHFMKPKGHVDKVGQRCWETEHVIRSDSQSSNPWVRQT